MDNGDGSSDNRVRNGETEDGSTGQDNVQEDGPKGDEDGPKGDGHVQEDDFTDQHDGHSAQHRVHEHGLEKRLEKSESRLGDVDTTAPIESVKDAASMFSEIVDWKEHKVQIAERRKRAVQELRKAKEEMPSLKKKSEAAEESKQCVLKELEDAKRRVEDLKLHLEQAQTEESQVKQDAELTILRVDELQQGIADESSVSAKAQLEVAQARHQAAVSELKAVKLELENLEKDYSLLVPERDLAIKNAQDAEASSIETEKIVEDLTVKRITTKEALESAHGAYLEAEEYRTEVAMDCEQYLEQLEEELEKISQLEAASVLLDDLEAEFESYMEDTCKDIRSAVDSAKTDLKEVKNSIENVTSEVNNMKLNANSLKSELEQEKATLVAVRQNGEAEAVVMLSLEADLMRTVSEVTINEMKEKMPKQVDKAAEEVEQAKSRARKAREELKKTKKAAKQAKRREDRLMGKLNAAVREVEAARASERFAHGAISAVEESESARSNESETESGITLSLEKYHELTRKAKEAEDEANDRVSKAISQIDLAKESELETMKKLEQVKRDNVLKKEELSATVEKAERAKEGKLVVERELRIWRSEFEQRRKAGTAQKKKKRSLIPRICLFLCRKEGRQSNKNI